MDFFDSFSREIEKQGFDMVIFDTAPTGHTLKLLNFPATMEKALGKFLGMKEKLQGVMQQVYPIPSYSLSSKVSWVKTSIKCSTKDSEDWKSSSSQASISKRSSRTQYPHPNLQTRTPVPSWQSASQNIFQSTRPRDSSKSSPCTK